MSANHPLNDDHLLDKTRHVVSRHQPISATPRDTMAVLMQEAEKVSNRDTSSVWNIFSLRWIYAMAALLILGVISWSTLNPANETPVAEMATKADTVIIADFGLDTAAWDMEIDALISELDTSLVSMANESSVNGIQTDGVLNNEEPWL